MTPLLMPSVSVSSAMTGLLCRIVQGHPVDWPQDADPADQERFVAACVAHGVAPLVYHCLHQSPTWPAWPDHIRTTLAHLGRVHTALPVLFEQELVRVLAALADHGVHALLMKGAPLAYTHYESPSLRPRCDTDVLLHPRDVVTAEQVLTTLGYDRLTMMSGALVTHQYTYVKADRHGVRHAYDMHWHISNTPLFANRLSFDELASRAISVPSLGEGALTLTPVHALLLACLHRVAHHQNSDRLIWLYDIHLLVSSMLPAELAEFPRLAAAKQLQAVCGSSLKLASQCMGTPLPEDFMPLVYAADKAAPDEATARYLDSDQRHWHLLLADLGALADWTSKCRFLWQSLFPPATYILHRYNVTNRILLPMLYIHRTIRGFWRLIHRLS